MVAAVLPEADRLGGIGVRGASGFALEPRGPAPIQVVIHASIDPVDRARDGKADHRGEQQEAGQRASAGRPRQYAHQGDAQEK